MWPSRAVGGGWGMDFARRYRGVMRSPVVPLLEPLLGGVWWIVGALALAAGPGTAVMALGLGVAGALVVAARRRDGQALAPGSRSRLVRIGVTAVVLVGIVATLLPLVGMAELTVPVACAITAGALFPAATVLEERGFVLAGAALLLVAAIGALLALRSGGLYPQGLVGMVSGAILWLIGAYRLGLFHELTARR